MCRGSRPACTLRGCIRLDQKEACQGLWAWEQQGKPNVGKLPSTLQQLILKFNKNSGIAGVAKVLEDPSEPHLSGSSRLESKRRGWVASHHACHRYICGPVSLTLAPLTMISFLCPPPAVIGWSRLHCFLIEHRPRGSSHSAVPRDVEIGLARMPGGSTALACLHTILSPAPSNLSLLPASSPRAELALARRSLAGNFMPLDIRELPA